jgi:hypothetical protein
MADGGSNWKRDLLVIPLIIGLVVAIFTYALPKLAEKGKRLSYTVEQSVPYLPASRIPNVTVAVGGVPVQQLFVHRAHIWNSGDVPLGNLPVLFDFSTSQPLQVLSATHDTRPQLEFGKISEVGSTPSSRRYIYELLNPGDGDVVTLLTDRSGKLMIYSKLESLHVSEVKPSERSGWSEYIGGVFSILAFLASFASVGLKIFAEKTNLWPFRG